MAALNDRALGVAARTDHPTLTAVRNEPALAALTAKKARYAETGNAALQERPEGKLSAGVRGIVARVCAFNEIRFQIVEDGPIERARRRGARPVYQRSVYHGFTCRKFSRTITAARPCAEFS